MFDLIAQIAQTDLANASTELENARSKIESLGKELEEAKVTAAFQRAVLMIGV
jgi:hypothetical protein